MARTQGFASRQKTPVQQELCYDARVDADTKARLKNALIIWIAGPAVFYPAYKLLYAIFMWWELREYPHGDGQTGMSVFFGAAFVALIISILTVPILYAVLERRRKSRSV